MCLFIIYSRGQMRSLEGATDKHIHLFETQMNYSNGQAPVTNITRTLIVTDRMVSHPRASVNIDRNGCCVGFGAPMCVLCSIFVLIMQL